MPSVVSSPIHLRTAVADDVPRLVALNRAAYPDLIEDDVVFHEKQIAAHVERFADGQIVAEHDGHLVGAIATLILPRVIDALAPHTWYGVTDNGYFTRHDPDGQTLYLADVYVDPAMQGRRVGGALYGALFALCRRLRLAHVVAGGRLWGYAEVAERMSAREYVDRVIAGELHDRVLVSQLRAGFCVRGILEGYLHDWRSRSFATLLEWQNPDLPALASRLPNRLPAHGLPARDGLPVCDVVDEKRR
jgi:GNAT superfamily N-acetyltransferase